MNRETLYASLAGSVSFILIAYGSYWYFSPAKPTANPVSESGSSPAKAVVAIPAETTVSTPIVVQPAAPDNASPPPAAPSRSAPPTPTAYGSATGADPQKTAPTVQEEEERLRSMSMPARRKPSQTVNDGRVPYEERRRRRSLQEDD
jgi:hypothetical protein